MSSKVRIAEVFLSMEGEGPLIGRPMIFVRVFGCNLTCPGFGASSDTEAAYVEFTEKRDIRGIGCDSAYAWHPAFKSQAVFMEPKELADAICALLKHRCYVCFTGGEPMLYQDALAETARMVLARQRLGECAEVLGFLIETNGTISPSLSMKALGMDASVTYSVSPKLSNSGEPLERRYSATALVAFTAMPSWYFKFVVSNTDDIAEAVSLLHIVKNKTGSLHHARPIEPSDVWLMPSGITSTDQERIQESIATYAFRNGFNFSPRVHCWVFNNKPGT